MHVVVMIEPAHKGEKLSASEQLNQIFGPFETEELAEAWARRASDIYAKAKELREWIVTPVDDPSVLNKLDPGSVN